MKLVVGHRYANRAGAIVEIVEDIAGCYFRCRIIRCADGTKPIRQLEYMAHSATPAELGLVREIISDVRRAAE